MTLPLIDIERDAERRAWIHILRCPTPSEMRALKGAAARYDARLYVSAYKRSLCRLAEWAGFRKVRRLGNRGAVYSNR